VLWVEEPRRATNLSAMAMLRAQKGVRIAGGEEARELRTICAVRSPMMRSKSCSPERRESIGIAGRDRTMRRLALRAKPVVHGPTRGPTASG